jgi:hypothetical protein
MSLSLRERWLSVSEDGEGYLKTKTRTASHPLLRELSHRESLHYYN